ncbi:hypothetical protein J7I94_08740 [Streptomyces sp. ISL-12]|uniref:hypothetical protein n=1 Tax=Streptomyces sp. ISL-12 TaxID=2819177 RepID=UPI001BE59342|nr:hypothetical protein [Streptomyces sp. ISL-12]MBT2410645.1 hypothetical protein [Streptomyces sp. ISL-12]
MSSVLAQAPTVVPPASRAATDHTGAPVRGGRTADRFPARHQGALRVATPSYRPDAPYPAVPFEADGPGVLRVIADPRTPVFVTVHTSGRRRYGYWQPYDSRTKRGGCYVALPSAVCEELYAGGRIALDGPLVDPGKTTYRVRPAGAPAPPSRLPAAPVRTPVPPVSPARAVPRPLAA